MSLMSSVQFKIGSVSLALPLKNLLAISVAGGFANTMTSIALGVAIGFPIPFAPILGTSPWLVSLYGGLYLTWRHELKTNKEARKNIIQFFMAAMSEVGLLFVYVAYSVVFSTTRIEYQTYVSFCLPFIKIFFKNLFNKGVFHMEDLAPTIVVFNVDLFHSLFMSITTQQARTSGSVGFLVVVDVIQNGIAVYEVVSVMNRIERSTKTLSDMGKSGDSAQESSRLRSLGVIEYAWSLLEKHPHLADHPYLSLPRHLHPDLSRNSSLHKIAVRVGAFARNAVTSKSTNKIDPRMPNERTSETGSSLTSLSQIDRMRVCIIRDAQKLLHMVEFYVLIEFCEVMIAVVYTLYILTLTYLPTRAYYTSFSQLTDHEMLTTVEQVAKYAIFESISFVAVCMVMDRLLKWRAPTYRQAAFAISSNLQMTQATIVMWVLFVVQVNFEHFGVDLTIQFKWLHTKTHPNG